MELPWAKAPPIQRDCFCTNRSLPMSFKSRANVVEVHMSVHSMSALEDYNNLYFEGSWEFAKARECQQKRRMRGPSGEIRNHLRLVGEEEEYCASQPWLIEPGPEQYLYVKLPGAVASNRTRCQTENRIVVHSAGKLHAAVCPRPAGDSRPEGVEVFSDGWSVSDRAMLIAASRDAARSIALEYVIREGQEEEEYSVTWLELTRRPSVTAALAGFRLGRDCEHLCPELGACINASLWCDGISHCPTGYDEALAHCSILLRLPPLHLGLGALLFLSVCGFLCLASWRSCRPGPGGRSISQHRLKSISSETAIIDGKEVIC